MSDESSRDRYNMNYPGNSHKSRDESSKVEVRKKVTRVTKSTPIQRKKPLGRRVAETFTGEDTRTVGQYILFDVLVPAAKAMISDAVSQGAERLLFGDSRPTSSRSPRKGNYTPYNRVSGGRSFDSSGSRELSRRGRSVHDFDEIVLESRGEAEEVLERLTDLIDNYDIATVSDLYDLVGITGSFTDDKWGWTNLRGAGVRRIREGYLLELPKTSPID